MLRTSLAGRSILILEDAPLIVLDIGDAFARAGAVVVPAKSLGTAHDLVEVNSLSAAVVDFRLGDGEADALCAKLTVRDIPFCHPYWLYARGPSERGRDSETSQSHRVDPRDSGTAFPEGDAACRERANSSAARRMRPAP
jgi:hypothetical protein